MRNRQSFFRKLDRIGRGAENFALLTLLSSLLLLAVGQIVLRQIFNTGFIWADELVKIFVLWLTMFGAVAAVRDNRHIRIDLLSHLFSRTALRYLQIAVDLFAALVCAVIAWHAWRYLQIEIEYNDTVLVDTPAWIAHIVVPAAFAILAYRFAVTSLARLFAAPLNDEQEPGRL